MHMFIRKQIMFVWIVTNLYPWQHSFKDTEIVRVQISTYDETLTNIYKKTIVLNL